MEARRSIKTLIPYVEEQLALGRNKMEVFQQDLHLNKNQVKLLNLYMRKDEPKKEEVEEYLIIPEHVHEKRYVFFKGKRYVDVTREFIDCGG